MDNFQTFIVAPLLALGMTTVLYLICKWVYEDVMGNQMNNGLRVTIYFFGSVVCFLISYLWFIPEVINARVINGMLDTQYETCKESFSSSQCQYFQDALNGKKEAE